MRAVIQRVTEATVAIGGTETSRIGGGLLILLGIEDADGDEDINWLTHKIANLRIFNDTEGIMNRSLQDVGGEALVVSQFTLHADTRKGHRPSYIRAAKPPVAVPIYETFIKQLEEVLEKQVYTGIFGADMQVHLVNDGPVTIILDTKNKKL